MPQHLVLKAVDFAARKHRDQRRKDQESSPYINHPVEVARLISDVGGVGDAEVLAAAVLHDTIEDTETTAAEIDAEFGPRIRALVEAVTDDKALPKLERKRLQVEGAAHLDPDAVLIKLADKISNVADLVRSPPRGWSLERRVEYLDWAEAVIANCPPASPALEARFAEVLAAGRRSLAARSPEPSCS